MKRRDFLGMVANFALANAAAHAQQPATKRRLAVIVLGKIEDSRIGRDPNATVFLEELQRLGYVEGRNLIVDRWQYQPGRLEEIAREVVDTKPDVISSPGTPMTLRLKAATTTVPIVAFTGDPIRFGLVSNLARPGGNITGVSVDAGVEVWAKRLELLQRRSQIGQCRFRFIGWRLDGRWWPSGARRCAKAAWDFSGAGYRQQPIWRSGIPRHILSAPARPTGRIDSFG